jgi:NAD-dependent deacetylase
MSTFQNIVILTGAGLSAESGLSTFRDAGGVWAKYDYRKVATPQGFRNNPALVHEFYNMRRRDVQNALPNTAHIALAELERNHVGRVDIVTQNVDNLHEVAGTRNLIHMHGELLKVFCSNCDHHCGWTDDLSVANDCPACRRSGGMRPDIVWFGEIPYQMERITELLQNADLFVSIGTSGNVYPAAGFVEVAKAAGAQTLELNLEPSEGVTLFDEAVHGPATRIVPQFVARMLARA